MFISADRRHRPVHWTTGLLAVALTAAPGAAQRATPVSELPACYGFSFGSWTPALDWKAAGHAAHPAQGAGERTAENRQWALNGVDGDSVMVLFPAWWPVGVTIAFARPPRALGDTVQARAVALVADARLHAPTSKARVWLVDCAARSK